MVKKFNDTNKIKMETINDTLTIKDISEGYIDNSEYEEGGITSMSGRLNIRPRYQRAYVVGEKKMWKENLINSIICGYPINRIYIGVDEEDRKSKQKDLWNLEMLDGQQRTKTICDFINDKYCVCIDGNYKYWSGIDNEYKQRILNYKLDITYCIGDESSRIKYFKRINQPNSILTEQELRNSTYVGEWLEDAKKYFCAASANKIKEINDKDEKYCMTKYAMVSSIERCEFLELALDWISYKLYDDLSNEDDKDERICRYMAQHQKDNNAKELIDYTHNLIDWIVDIFWHKQNKFPSAEIFKKADWGRLFREYGTKEFTTVEKENITENILEVSDVNNLYYKKPHGVFEWMLQGGKEEEKHKYLEIREFSKQDIKLMYSYQNGICPIDGKHYELKEMEAHHIKSRRSGGLSTIDNMVLLSKENHHKVHADLNITSVDLRNKRDELLKKNDCKNILTLI